MKKSVVWFVAVLLLTVFCLPVASHAEVSADKLAKLTSDDYMTRAPHRLMHGAVNAGFGWTRMFTGIKYELEEKKRTVFHGIGRGILETGYYTISGIFDVATFWVPGEKGKLLAIKECVFDDRK